MRELSAKCSITLLKYPDLIPQDKAFYQAGMACREQGNINLSFLLLNRFVKSFSCVLFGNNYRVVFFLTIDTST